MRPTRFGIHAGVFYAVMLAAFFASPYSNLFFLLLGFLTLLGLHGALAARRNLAGVLAELGELPPVPTDAEVQVPIRVHAGARTRFQVEVRLYLEGGSELGARADLLEGSTVLRLRSDALPRGIHGVRGAVVESVHPFGLLRVRRAVSAPPSELVVYPGPRSLVEGRTAVEALDELLGQAAPSEGDLQPTSLRDHREGEGIRGIHWRASARRSRLVVQEWEGGSGRGLEVVLDRRSSPDALEGALATISAMVELARSGKETLRVHSQGLSATYGEGQRPWPEALRFLAGASVLPPHAAPPPPVSPSVTRLPRAARGARGAA